jgi:hypothetical protein
LFNYNDKLSLIFVTILRLQMIINELKQLFASS